MAFVLGLLAPEEAGARAVDNARELARKQSPLRAVATLEAEREQRPQLASRDAPLLAQLSMSYSVAVDEYNRKKDRAKAEESARKAVATAEEAVRLNERLADGHLALAIAYGKLAGFVDNSTKLQYSPVIYREAHRALALNPREDIAHHILGRWHLSLSTLGAMKRLAARAIYGDLPKGSLKEAIAHLEKAAVLNPGYAPHHRRLAEALEADGRKREARPHWQKVLDLPAKDDEDRRAHKAAKRALEK